MSSCFKNGGGSVFTPIKRDLSMICGGSWQEALILHLIDAISYKKYKRSGWVSISMRRFIWLCHGVGTDYSIRNALKSLEAKDFIHKKPSNTAAPKYCLNLALLEEKLLELEEDNVKMQLAIDTDPYEDEDDPTPYEIKGGSPDSKGGIRNQSGVSETGEGDSEFKGGPSPDSKGGALDSKTFNKLLSNSSKETVLSNSEEETAFQENPVAYAPGRATLTTSVFDTIVPTSQHPSSISCFTEKEGNITNTSLPPTSSFMVENTPLTETATITPTASITGIVEKEEPPYPLPPMSTEHDTLSIIASMYARLKEKEKHDTAKGSAAKFMSKHGDRLIGVIREYGDLTVPAFEAFLADDYWKTKNFPPNAFIKQAGEFVSKVDSGTQDGPPERKTPAFQKQQREPEAVEPVQQASIKTYQPLPVDEKRQRKVEALDMLVQAESPLHEQASRELEGKSDLIDASVIEKWHTEGVKAWRLARSLDYPVSTRSLNA